MGMAEESTALGWIRWPLVAKGVALGIGFGLILAVQLESLASGVLIGATFGLSTALSRSFVTRDER